MEVEDSGRGSDSGQRRDQSAVIPFEAGISLGTFYF